MLSPRVSTALLPATLVRARGERRRTRNKEPRDTGPRGPSGSCLQTLPLTHPDALLMPRNNATFLQCSYSGASHRKTIGSNRGESGETSALVCRLSREIAAAMKKSPCERRPQDRSAVRGKRQARWDFRFCFDRDLVATEWAQWASRES